METITLPSQSVECWIVRCEKQMYWESENTLPLNIQAVRVLDYKKPVSVRTTYSGASVEASEEGYQKLMVARQNSTNDIKKSR